MSTTYLFDHEWKLERDRLGLIEQFLDPQTIAAFERIEVGAGWRCLEVGGGAGSIARWLSDRVGPTGTVTATDLQTTFLEAIQADNLTVLRHDITTDELDVDHYDLVHARAVVENVRDADAALDKMVEATRPGGYAVIEVHDMVSLVPGVAEVGAFEKVNAGVVASLRAAGFDAEAGRSISTRLRRRGLDVTAQGYVAELGGRRGTTTGWLLIVERLAPMLLSSGSVTEADLEEAKAQVEREDFAALAPIIVTAIGRKPAEG